MLPCGLAEPLGFVCHPQNLIHNLRTHLGACSGTILNIHARSASFARRPCASRLFLLIAELECNSCRRLAVPAKADHAGNRASPTVRWIWHYRISEPLALGPRTGA